MNGTLLGVSDADNSRSARCNSPPVSLSHLDLRTLHHRTYQYAIPHVSIRRSLTQRDLIALRTIVRALRYQTISRHHSTHLMQSPVLLIRRIHVSIVRHRCELLVVALMAQLNRASYQMCAHHYGENGDARARERLTRAAVYAMTGGDYVLLKWRYNVAPIRIHSCLVDWRVSFDNACVVRNNTLTNRQNACLKRP